MMINFKGMTINPYPYYGATLLFETHVEENENNNYDELSKDEFERNSDLYDSIPSPLLEEVKKLKIRFKFYYDFYVDGFINFHCYFFYRCYLMERMDL
jgi:hypothetical protein